MRNIRFRKVNGPFDLIVRDTDCSARSRDLDLTQNELLCDEHDDGLYIWK